MWFKHLLQYIKYIQSELKGKLFINLKENSPLVLKYCYFQYLCSKTSKFNSALVSTVLYSIQRIAAHIQIQFSGKRVKWKISQDPKCSICNVKHDIPHLLFFCNKAKRAWSHLKKSTGLDLTFEQILTGILLDKDTNHVVTLYAFLIYKEWLLNHNSVAQWLKNDIVLFIKS